MDADSKTLPIALCLGILAVYLLLPTKNYYWDGIGFAQSIEDAHSLSPNLIHPNHLLYTAAGYADYRLVQALGFHPRALTVLRITNSILSAAAAYLFFWILVRSFASVYLSCALTILFAFSANWWTFSTDACAYIPAVLLLLACFRLILPWNRSRPIALAVAHSAAMLFHELSIFFLPVALAGLLRQSLSLPSSKRKLVLAEYVTVAFGVTAAVYWAAFRWSHPESGASIPAFASWITSHSSDSSFSWNVARDTLLSLRGNLRLFLGGRPSLALRQWPRFTIPLAFLLVLILAMLVFRLLKHRSAFRAPAHEPSRNPKLDGIRALAGIWSVMYLLFLFVWLPGNTFYRLFYLPALVLLAGAWLAPHRDRVGPNHTYAAAMLAIAIAVANLAFDIFPNSKVQSNPPLAFALNVNRAWFPGTVIYFHSFNTDDWTIRYFNPQTAWKQIDASNRTLLEPELQQLQNDGKAAWADTTALDAILSSPTGLLWLAEHKVGSERFELMDDRHRIAFQRLGTRNPLPESSAEKFY